MDALYDLSGKFFDGGLSIDAGERECLRRSIEKFCKTGRKEDAFSVYFCYCEIFRIFGTGYDTMSKLLEFLSDHEYHSGELLSKHRDHYSHSAYVFALGLAVYARDGEYAKIFDGFYDDDLDKTQFLRLWGMASLFHDIGYPFQLAHEQIKTYTSQLWGENYDYNPFVSYDNMEGILRLNEKNRRKFAQIKNVDTVNDLLAWAVHHRLNYPFEEISDKLNSRFKNQAKFIDHGYFSAVLLAKQLMDCEADIDDAILDVLSAILLHNSLNRYDLKSASPISPNDHPIAYLLILCDELQNWDRTAFGYISKKDPLAWKVKLDVKDSSLSIDYYFDEFQVCDPSGDNGSRLNKNVEKLRNGNFERDVIKLFKFDERYTLKLKASAVKVAKDKKEESFVSSDKFINLCDFAKAIHYVYQKEYGGSDFEDLSLEFKLSNIEQAKSYSKKLELINCFYSDRELDYPIVNSFSEFTESGGNTRNDLSFLAREEHIRWVREKIEAGWKYGTDYCRGDNNAERDSKKIHKDIIPYDFLSAEIKEKNEKMVANMIPFLYENGHGIRIYSYRSGRKPVLDIVGCGARTVPMNDERIIKEVKDILLEYSKDYRVVVRTNLAFGADQLITKCAIDLGITVKAALPMEYERYIDRVKADAEIYNYNFTEDDEYRMRHLMAQTVSCKVCEDDEFTYRAASKYIVSRCKKIIAICDGMEKLLQNCSGKPINQGGTWYKISLAKNSRGLENEDVHIINYEI